MGNEIKSNLPTGEDPISALEALLLKVATDVNTPPGWSWTDQVKAIIEYLRHREISYAALLKKVEDLEKLGFREE